MKKLLLVAFVLSAGVAGYGVAHYVYSPSNSATASHGVLTLPDLNGIRRAAPDWQGRLIVINFWATWCPPCREEIPELIALQERYQDQGLQIVGVAVDNHEAVRRFSDAVGINYPVLLGQLEAMQAMSDYGNRGGSLPFTVVIEPSGQVVARKLGVYRYSELEAILRPYLKPSNDAKTT